MNRCTTIRIGMLTLALGAVALVGVAVGSSTGALHHPMNFAHGGPGLHFVINSLIDDLNLTDEQQGQLDAVHEKVTNHINENMGARAEHHGQMLGQIASGTVDVNEVKTAIDQHLEETQLFAHVIADDLVAFVNSLDDEQRATLVEKLERLHEFMAARHSTDNREMHSTH